MEKINILGVKVDNLTVEELHQHIADTIEKNRHEPILNVNVNCLNLAQENAWLKQFLNNAPVVFCDGVGVMLGARILGYRIKQRITYADWMWQLAQFAETNQYSIFILGGKPKIAEKAAKKLLDKNTDLIIVGTHHGYFNKTKTHPENIEVINQINQSNPNILVVSFGMPLQEKWVFENWGEIKANIALTGGAALDYVSGELKRAPKWMTDHGLEWLGRMLIEPGRLWRRYILGNPLFLSRIMLQKIGRLRV